jgi:hypothetical protein
LAQTTLAAVQGNKLGEFLLRRVGKLFDVPGPSLCARYRWTVLLRSSIVDRAG